MAALRWLTALPTPAMTVDGRPTKIVTGLVDVAGDTRIALRTADGDPALLGVEATAELITNVERTAIAKADRDRRGI